MTVPPARAHQSQAARSPQNPMPRDGKSAASTALPQPANVSQNAPKNSGPRRRIIFINNITFESP